MRETVVYIVRHAKAEKEAPRGDAARRLTPDGRRRFQALLETLDGRLAPSRVVTSPLVRARETAELLAAATGVEVQQDEALASGASRGSELLAIARRAGAGTALVGHNPEVAEAIAIAAGAEQHVRPGTIAAVELARGGARLVWLATPERDD
jgi:phosphohistidine phosphatase